MLKKTMIRLFCHTMVKYSHIVEKALVELVVVLKSFLECTDIFREMESDVFSIDRSRRGTREHNILASFVL